MYYNIVFITKIGLPLFPQGGGVEEKDYFFYKHPPQFIEINGTTNLTEEYYRFLEDEADKGNVLIARIDTYDDSGTGKWAMENKELLLKFSNN